MDDACPGAGFEKCIACDPGYLLDESSGLCRGISALALLDHNLIMILGTT